MVFYTFDYTNFPEVRIVFSRNIRNDEVDGFFKEWFSIYKFNRDFHMLFDITKLHSAPMKHVITLVKFINKLKKQKPQRLKYSIIIINDSTVMKFIMKTAMTLTSPAADLYLYWKKQDETVNVDNIKQLFMEKRLDFQHFPS